MKIWFRFLSALRNLLRPRKVESELSDEVRAYVDLVADERIAAGMPYDEARRTALIDFGGIEQVKQAVRQQRSGIALDLLGQDVRYGLRQLRHNPGFTLTAVITLGVGIGATSANFSAVYALLLRPLPYPNAGRLYYVANNTPAMHNDLIVSPDFVAAQYTIKSFEQFAAYVSMTANMTGAETPMRVNLARVTANFFPMLSVVPQLGRGFTSEEDRQGGPALILLSDRVWRSQFHADPQVVGKAVAINGKEETIIGVMPARFSFPDLLVDPDIYGPAAFDSDTNLSVEKPVYSVAGIARLAAGVAPENAQAEVQAFFAARAQASPREFASMTAGRRMLLVPLQRHISGDDSKPLYILLACVGAVLLIACANVANLQLARAVVRRHEIALRGALGASRLRLVRQLLVESLLISSMAAALGVGIAVAITATIRHAGVVAPTELFTPSSAIQSVSFPLRKLGQVMQVDGWVLAFAAGLALLTTLLFGFAPAISGTKSDLRNALQTAALRITQGRDQRFLRHALLVAEVSLAMILLSSAGLLVRSFVNVVRSESGFDASGTLTAGISLSGDRYQRVQEIRRFVEELLPRLRALPGVESAALASALPLGPAERYFITFDDNANPPVDARQIVTMITVTPDYFRTMRTPIVAGRAFDGRDSATSARTVIVTRAFAHRFLSDDALGKRFRVSTLVEDHHLVFEPATIVGIAEDVRHGGLEQDVQPELFVPMDQFPTPDIQLAVRSDLASGPLADSMREAVMAVDREQPLFNVETLEQRVSTLIGQRRFMMSLMVCFAAIAVLLSGVGVYGVFVYSVNQRTQEMGIRLALGASRAGLLRLVVMQAARLIALGGLIGVNCALLLDRLLSSILVRVTSHDALTLAAAWFLMTTVALLASVVPASQAARIDLISVLRSE